MIACMLILAVLAAFAFAFELDAGASPYEEGKALGAQHAKFFTSGESPNEAEMEEQKKAFEAKYAADEKARDEFVKGYMESFGPAMEAMLSGFGEELGRAMGEVMKGVGEGMAKGLEGMAKGMQEAFEPPLDENSAEAKPDDEKENC